MTFDQLEDIVLTLKNESWNYYIQCLMIRLQTMQRIVDLQLLGQLQNAIIQYKVQIMDMIGHQEDAFVEEYTRRQVECANRIKDFQNEIDKKEKFLSMLDEQQKKNYRVGVNTQKLQVDKIQNDQKEIETEQARLSDRFYQLRQDITANFQKNDINDPKALNLKIIALVR